MAPALSAASWSGRLLATHNSPRRTPVQYEPTEARPKLSGAGTAIESQVIGPSQVARGERVVAPDNRYHHQRKAFVDRARLAVRCAKT